MKPVMNVKKIKHRELFEATKKQILAASGNQCAFPTCDRIIVDREHNVIVGKIAHIKARSAGRITFPIYNINGKIHGFMGRRPDNRGTHWIKQQKQDTEICTRGWLYGIDKAARYIEYYTTIIIVEGIFDYFAFYRLLQDANKPIVVSTLGTRLTDETISLLQQLNIKNIIVAYDWDNAGRAGIKKIAKDLDCTIYYLGGMKPDEDPADKLKDLQNIISGFSLKHLSTSAKNIQKQTDKPVGLSFLSSSSPKPSKEIIFKPDTTLDVSSTDPQKPGKAPEK